MSVVEVILAVVLLGASLIGVVMTVLQLPGTWLILAAATAFAWYHDWRRITLPTIGVLALIALVAEAGETLSAMWMARRSGGTRRGAWYGLIGGIAGALLLSVPVPIIGTLIGAAVGCFVGALLGELREGTDPVSGARIGAYSAIGRTLGTTLKIAAALIMVVVALVSALTVS